MLFLNDFSDLLPHKGSMLLLDCVVRYDAFSIHCPATSHRRLDNPLRLDGKLSALTGIEYGAQAAGLHHALLEQSPQQPLGTLAVARDVVILAERLDDLTQPLAINARRLAAEAGGCIYAFDVAHEGAALLRGRLTLALHTATQP